MAKIKRLCVLLLLIMVSCLGAGAQGTVRGTVLDSANDESLIGATVRLSGTSMGATTDLDGNFSIPSVPKGVYTITVSYISFKTQTFPNVVVENGQTVVLDVKLHSDDELLGEVVVTAKANRESQNALLLEQKRALIATQAIGAIELSVKGISNAEAAVSRIAGVSKNEGEKNVFIRGLADRYNATYLNGFPIPSDDPEYKNIALEIFDTDMIQSVTVGKAFNAHQGGDVAGAIVDIQSKELVGDRVFDISASVGVNETVIGRKFMRQDGTSYFGRSHNAEPSPSHFDASGEAKLGIAYPLAGAVTPTRVAAPVNHGIGLAIGRRWTIADRHPLSILLVANHSVSYALSERIARVMDVSSGGVIGDMRGPKSDIGTRQLALLNANLELSKKHNIEYNLLLVHNNQQFVAKMEGADSEINQDGPGNLTSMLRQQANDNLLIVNQLDSRWKVADALYMGIGGSLNLMRAHEPDRKSFYMAKDTPDLNDIVTVDGVSKPREYWVPAGSNRIDRFFSNLKENDYNLKLGLDWKFSEGSFVTLGYRGRWVKHRFGAREYDHSFRSIRYELDDFDGFRWEELFSDANMPKTDRPQPGIPYMNVVRGGEQWYTSTKSIHAPFVDVVYQILPNLTVQGGLRVDLVDMVVQNGREQALFDRSEIHKRYLLPSLNVKYDLNDQHTIRLSASKSYTLPQVKEISPFKYIHIGYASQGSPDLKPSELWNADLKWDYYLSPSELISVTAFYKEVRNPLARAYNANSAALHEYINPSEKADVMGVEVELKKDIINLYRLNTETRNKLTVGLNASYLYSRLLLDIVNVEPRWTSLEGASPWLLNGDLTYSYSRMDTSFSLSALLSYFSDRIVTYGTVGNKYDKIEPGVAKVDLTAQWSPSKHFSVKLKANNLLDAAYRNVQKPNDGAANSTPIVMSEYHKGRSYSVSLSYKF